MLFSLRPVCPHATPAADIRDRAGVAEEEGRSFTVLSTNDDAASARGRNSAMTSSCILRNRAEWRTRGARHVTAANAQLSGPAVTTDTTKPRPEADLVSRLPPYIDKGEP